MGCFRAMWRYCPHIFHLIYYSECAQCLGERCLKDCVITTKPGLIYRISATDAVRKRPSMYFLPLDESKMRASRVFVQGYKVNLSDYGTVLIYKFGRNPSCKIRTVPFQRFGYDSTTENCDSDNGIAGEYCGDVTASVRNASGIGTSFQEGGKDELVN